MTVETASGESPTATRRAYLEIKSRIFDARLAPNEHRLEGELAVELGMSRTPIREACLRLQSEGLVDVVPRRGIRVRPISPDDLAEIYDLLALLEARAAELAANRRLDDAALAGLAASVTQMEERLEADDLEGWADADDRFHRELVEAGGNRHLAAAVIEHADRVHRARLVTLRLRPPPTTSVRDHADLVDLIRRGDGERAFSAHLVHRRATATLLVELLRNHRLGAV